MQSNPSLLPLVITFNVMLLLVNVVVPNELCQ